jgi:hypothetical protein
MRKRSGETGYEENLAITITLNDLDHEAPTGLLPPSVTGKKSRASRVLEDFPDALTGPC